MEKTPRPRAPRGALDEGNARKDAFRQERPLRAPTGTRWWAAVAERGRVHPAKGIPAQRPESGRRNVRPLPFFLNRPGGVPGSGVSRRAFRGCARRRLNGFPIHCGRDQGAGRPRDDGFRRGLEGRSPEGPGDPTSPLRGPPESLPFRGFIDAGSRCRRRPAARRRPLRLRGRPPCPQATPAWRGRCGSS